MDVARQDYGIDGRPTNNSRVAMLTGLSRREVARVRDCLLESGAANYERQGNRMALILTGWHVDPEFVGKNGEPKDLPLEGRSGSLSRLLKRYAGDLPHGAIRKEMLQRELIEELGDGRFRVLKRDYIYTDTDPDRVRQMGIALHDHAATLEHNLNNERRSPPRFERLADNAAISIDVAAEFQEHIQRRGLQFLQEIDAWLTNHEVEDREDPDTQTVRLGVGVYLIQDDS